MERTIWTGVTIDGPTSRDLDDAIDVIPLDNGWQIDVFISNVAAMVPTYSSDDLKAYERGFTRYHYIGNTPMLARYYSETHCSLLPNRNRRVVRFRTELNTDLTVRSFAVSAGPFRSKARFSYEEVDLVLDQPASSDHNYWRNTFELTQRLLQRRRDAGALVVFDLKKGTMITEDGEVVKIPSGRNYRAYVIVQELMILTNHLATDFLLKHGVPFIVRNHQLREVTLKEAYLKHLAELSADPTPELLSQLGEECRTVMQRARYGVENLGHFALNLPCYSHWTSPIRRFVDLVNHRQLLCFLNEEQPPYETEELQKIADHINDLSDKERDRKDDTHRQRRHATYQRANEQKLNVLPEGDFSSFVELVAEESIPLNAERVNAISARFERGAIPLIDVVRIVFSPINFPDWKKLREQALSWLASNPDQPLQAAHHAFQQDWAPDPETIVLTSARGTETSWNAYAVIPGDRTRIFLGEPTSGASREEAERLALVSLLAKLAGIETTLTEILSNQPIKKTATPNPKGRLLEYCQKRQAADPVYETKENDKRSYCSCVTIRIGEKESRSRTTTAKSKAEAEKLAALDLLSQLPRQSAGGGSKRKRLKPVSPDEPVGFLLNWARENSLPEPVFECKMAGESHAPVFTCRCLVRLQNGSVPEFCGTAGRKQDAKTKAAHEALKGLGLIEKV